MPYLRMIREAAFTAFISGRTRADYALRIRRCASADVGPVLPLGADGLALGQQTFAAGKRSYVVLGAINRYKNQDRVFAAFRHLWREGFDGSLVMIGLVHDPTAEGWLREAGREPRFRHLADASDEQVRAELRDARATIFVSEVEGFGLPPVESLFAGIPVIVTAGTPSIADLPAGGQIRLASADVPAVAAAVCSLADDAAAARLWREAASLQLSTWREFARCTADWIHECRRESVDSLEGDTSSSRPRSPSCGH
jgi:glycosyltransferase involved in cell wall biosynthesis